jgi:hypothetical protein
MKLVSTLRRLLGQPDRAVQLLAEIREGVANLTDVTDRRLRAIEAARLSEERLWPVDVKSSVLPAKFTGSIRSKTAARPPESMIPRYGSAEV